jgi:hypothetical protein
MTRAFFLATCSIALAASAATPVNRIASPPWNAVNVKPELAAVYADRLAESLRQAKMSVITAQDMATVIGMEQQRQLLSCDEASSNCLVELANALGCDAVLIVNLARLDDGAFRGVAKLVGSRDGSVLASTPLDGDSERGLLKRLDEVGAILSTQLNPSAPTSAAVSAVSAVKTPATAFWWIPGSVGIAGLGTGAALFALAGQRYAAVDRAATYAEATQLARDGVGLQTVAWVGLGLGAAAVATTVVFWVLKERPPAVRGDLVVSPRGATLAVSGAW